ncbi:HD domain-containing protein [Patescibacteria group bacterium]
MVKESEKQMEGMYGVLAEAYLGNWQYRWRDTSYLENALREGKVEPITGHAWGTMEFWFLLRRVCPNLESLVDSRELYEILLNHDLGETYKGDVPLYKKIYGEVDDKEVERQGVEKICEQLPDASEELIRWFDEFEKDVDKVDRLEIIVAKWIDNLQGNHFAMTFGEELSKHSKPINSILQIRFVPYTNRLIQVLEDRKEENAVGEVKEIVRYHTKLIKAKGINFDTSRLNA